MTSEEAIDVVAKKDAKKTDECSNFEISNNKKEKAVDDQRVKRSQELMRLVYELPDDIKEPELIENNNMLKENPPITIVEITEQNGCAELSSNQCDTYFEDGDPESLGNTVVFDVLATNELIMQCTEEFKKVIDRSSPDECDVSDEDLYELKKILESKPKVLERYIRECANTDEVTRLHNLTSLGPLSPRPHHEARSTSVTSDLFQLWLSSSPVKVSKLHYCDVIIQLNRYMYNLMGVCVVCFMILYFLMCLTVYTLH